MRDLPGGFELAGHLIVEDVPVDVYELGVFPVLVDVLVGFDEIIGSLGFHALSIDVVSVKFNGHHDVLCLHPEMTGKQPV